MCYRFDGELKFLSVDLTAAVLTDNDWSATAAECIQTYVDLQLLFALQIRTALR